jgi:hypothetical protein
MLSMMVLVPQHEANCEQAKKDFLTLFILWMDTECFRHMVLLAKIGQKITDTLHDNQPAFRRALPT